jgi:NitT/TauT family transport system substrate-binding protein
MNIRMLAAAAAAAGVAASGCDDAPSRGERTKLTVGVVPIFDVAPIYVGDRNGFFEDEGIELDIRPAQGGAEIVPAVMSGDAQVGFSNTPSLFSAAVEGLPVQIVAPAGSSVAEKRRGGENIEAAVMVREGSPIRTHADLEGQTVAVSTLGNLADVALKGALEKRGVDPGTLEFLEAGFPDMLVALDEGRVDAAVVVSPFKTIAERSGGYRSVMFPVFATRPGQVNTSYFVSRNWAEENPELLERFLAALRRSMQYAAAHVPETRRAIAEYSEVPDELVPAIPIGDRRPDCAELEASSELLAGLMVRYRALEREPDLGELIRPGFCDM